MTLFKKIKKEDKEDGYFVTGDGLMPFETGARFDPQWGNPYVDKEKDDTSGKEFLSLSLSHERLNLFFSILALGLLLLLSKILYLQIIKGDYYKQVAEGNRIRIQTVKSNRGIIYDRTGMPLVQNIPDFSLYMVPADLPAKQEEKDQVFSDVSRISGIEKEEIMRAAESEEVYIGQPIELKPALGYDEALLLKISEQRLPGIYVETGNRRKYFNENNLSMSQILGYTGKLTQEEWEANKDKGYTLTDYIGKTGIELQYEKELKGTHGKKQVEVDALGVEKKILAQEPPVDGDSLVLSIDFELQAKAIEILEKYLEDQHREKGAIVMIDPRNGEILAMINYPSFDNNDFSGGISSEKYRRLLEDENRPLYDRAIKGEYPSGSVIKPVIAAAALEDGIINEHTSFLSSGGISVGGWFFPDWLAGGHGITDVRKAIAQSVNTFFYIVGGGYGGTKGLGPERIHYYAELFGLNKQLGVDLPGESGGLIPTPQWKMETKNEPWYIGDTYHMAIGQGDVLVTPLQVAAYTSVFANGGTLYRPHFLKQVIDPKGKVKKEIEPEIIREDFISDHTINVVREGMRDTVLYGSGRRLSLLKFSSAGKTGTAQFSTKKDPHAWFICFAPYEKPQIAMAILVEEGEEGSIIASPMAKEILEWWGEHRMEIVE